MTDPKERTKDDKTDPELTEVTRDHQEASTVQDPLKVKRAKLTTEETEKELAVTVNEEVLDLKVKLEATSVSMTASLALAEERRPRREVLVRATGDPSMTPPP
jgi:protein subunit release factor A